MTKNCPKCGSEFYEVGYCHNCDHLAPEDPLGDRFTNNCPKCGQPFNSWDCLHCGFSIPEKAKKMVGRQLTAEEIQKLKEELGG